MNRTTLRAPPANARRDRRPPLFFQILVMYPLDVVKTRM